MEDQDFFKKLLEAFRSESKERVERITDDLLKLEDKNNINTKLTKIENIYREVHSLKSAARAVSLTPIEKVFRKMEDIFSLWKKTKYIPDRLKLDILHKINTVIESLIDHSHNLSGPDIKKADSLIELLDKLKLDISQIENEKIITSHNDGLNRQDNIKIEPKKLDEILMQAEELITSKLNFNLRSDEIIEIKRMISENRSKFQNALYEVKLANIDQNDKIQNTELRCGRRKTAEFFEWGENNLKLMEQKIDSLLYKYEQDLHTFSINLDNLLDDAKKLMLIPFSTLLNLFPKIARNLSRDLNKELELIVEGDEIEIDKRILEEIKDVLLHLLRNAIDHGIETPKVREKLNKPGKGIVKISIRQLSGNEISIRFSDDGAGINIESVKKSAVKAGILSEESKTKLSLEDSLNLIYQSGISTSQIISDLSGRGLGMAIIREKIEKVGGKISLKTQEKIGTTIQIDLPLTMATFNGVLIKSSGKLFIIPTANLERIIRVHKTQIKTVENKEAIAYENHTIPLVFLSDILGLEREPPLAENAEHLLAIVVSVSEKKVAFMVDEILNEYEILVKNFVKPIIKLKNISSAAILGSGKAVPILNCLDILSKASLDTVGKPLNKSEDTKDKGRNILLAEDSITTRMLLKNILELGGYLVTTAVDGLDAWEKLFQGNFSIVISDVEMPRMDGFKLTEKIRKDKNISKLPVVLVTARETREDREHGIEVGANAYLPKSTFDSGQLLEIVTRLKI